MSPRRVVGVALYELAVASCVAAGWVLAGLPGAALALATLTAWRLVDALIHPNPSTTTNRRRSTP